MLEIRDVYKKCALLPPWIYAPARFAHGQYAALQLRCSDSHGNKWVLLNEGRGMLGYKVVPTPPVCYAPCHESMIITFHNTKHLHVAMLVATINTFIPFALSFQERCRVEWPMR